MEITVDFPGDQRVDAHFPGFTVKTDQPSKNNPGSAPTPFSLFLSSLVTCAGIYVLGFCQQRGLPTDRIKITQRIERDPSIRMISKIELEIQVPPSFPEKYRSSLIRSAELCAVKKHMENPPQFEVFTKEIPSD